MDIAQKQTVAPEVSTSTIHPDQDDNQEESSAGENGNQQFPSSSSNFSSMDIAQNQRVAPENQLVSPEVSPSTMHQEQDGNQEEPLEGEDGKQQFSSSSLNVSSMDTAELIEQPTDLLRLRIERSFLDVDDKCQAPKLTSLVFFNCGSLKSLQWIQSFKALQSLYINKCPELESLPVEGLPSSLVILCISFCEKITPQRGWKLDKLHSLRHFEIEGGCLSLKSFPEEGLLPTNLNSLHISRLLNLTSLNGKGLQNLTSLQKLEINCCDNLDSLPEHGMPSSLSSLSITNCSLLNPKLQNRKEKEWFKIVRISSIHLDEVKSEKQL
ncbi:hypothetical protein PTKIN_Ptkin16aG0018400 [Pterospermum kingtungense]